MASFGDTTTTKDKYDQDIYVAPRQVGGGSSSTVNLARLGNDIAAMKRRIRGFNLALGYLHQAYSEELLEGVEQLALDIEREAERLEQVADNMLERVTP